MDSAPEAIWWVDTGGGSGYATTSSSVAAASERNRPGSARRYHAGSEWLGRPSVASTARSETSDLEAARRAIERYGPPPPGEGTHPLQRHRDSMG
jgi:hypothetical protein